MKFLNRYIRGPLLESFIKHAPLAIGEVNEKGGRTLEFALPQGLYGKCVINDDTVSIEIMMQENDDTVYKNQFIFEITMFADLDAKALIELVLEAGVYHEI